MSASHKTLQKWFLCLVLPLLLFGVFLTLPFRALQQARQPNSKTHILPIREWGFGGMAACGPHGSTVCQSYGFMEVCTTYGR